MKLPLTTATLALAVNQNPAMRMRRATGLVPQAFDPYEPPDFIEDRVRRHDQDIPMLEVQKQYRIYGCTRKLLNLPAGTHCYLELWDSGHVPQAGETPHDSLSYGPDGYGQEQHRDGSSCTLLRDSVTFQEWTQLEANFRECASQAYNLGIVGQANHCCACATDALKDVFPQIQIPQNFKSANFGIGVKP